MSAYSPHISTRKGRSIHSRNEREGRLKYRDSRACVISATKQRRIIVGCARDHSPSRVWETQELISRKAGLTMGPKEKDKILGPEPEAREKYICSSACLNGQT